MPAPASDYIGRFAPSPTGPLHFGSLVAALASYLDARAHGGRWLLRMEDLDPPREMPGASDAILTGLEAHGLLWDGPVMYQSQRGEAYEAALEYLDSKHLLYPCFCSRKSVAAAGGIYPGTCRRDYPGSALAAAGKADRPAALRLKSSHLPPGLSSTVEFQDLIFGHQRRDLAKEVGDFIVRRKDRLFAYQLAVVVDDRDQGITDVIRGSDLLDSTAQQIFLFRLLNSPVPRYGHLPVAVDHYGQKLSKQQGAPSLETRRAADNLLRGLEFLGQKPPVELKGAACREILDWSIGHWDRGRIARTMALPEPD